jgi:putative nucleotidyltransferase with HDIG domain
MNELMDVDCKPLTEQIRKAVESGEINLPPLPEVGHRILQLIEEDSPSTGRKINELMRHEPAISATVLRMANSASFGGLQAITELPQAIARIGWKQVGSIVTALVHKGMFVPESDSKREILGALWDHAVATALSARQLAGISGGDVEQAFLAGMLHDVGKLLVLKGADYLESTDKDVVITPPVMSELMTGLHADLGYSTLKSWNFPETVCQAARCHHDNTADIEEMQIVRVQAANAISRQVAEHPDPGPEQRLHEVEAVERLGVGDVELAAMMVDLEDELADLKSLL